MKKNGRDIQGGFTLAEVLIVVVIIGVLAATIVPRFALQKDKAKTTEAIGIMTDIHKAVLQYYDERGAYPAAQADNTLVKSVLGIDYQAPKLGWVFTLDGSGGVIGTNSGAGTVGTLTLSATGNWTGGGKYDSTNGPLWPDLPT